MDRGRKDVMGTPRSAFTGEIRLHLDGNGRLVAECHRGLLEYGQKCIRLRGRAMQLIITGQELELEAIGAEDLIVIGSMEKIEFKPI